MGVVVDLAQPFGIDVAVHLGSRERRMAEQFLDRAQVGAALQQVRGEGMSQTVRMGDEAAQRRGVEPVPARREEERVLRATRELRARVAQVARNEARRFLSERHNSILAALAAPDVHELLFEVDVAEIEPDRLRTAQPGRVDELDERLIAERERPFRAECVDDALDLTLLQCVGEPARPPRREGSVGHPFRPERMSEE